jgi:hypothetical protein
MSWGLQTREGKWLTKKVVKRSKQAAQMAGDARTRPLTTNDDSYCHSSVIHGVDYMCSPDSALEREEPDRLLLPSEPGMK